MGLGSAAPHLSGVRASAGLVDGCGEQPLRNFLQRRLQAERAEVTGGQIAHLPEEDEVGRGKWNRQLCGPRGRGACMQELAASASRPFVVPCGCGAAAAGMGV